MLISPIVGRRLWLEFCHRVQQQDLLIQLNSLTWSASDAKVRRKHAVAINAVVDWLDYPPWIIVSVLLEFTAATLWLNNLKERIGVKFERKMKVTNMNWLGKLKLMHKGNKSNAPAMINFVMVGLVIFCFFALPIFTYISNPQISPNYHWIPYA